MPAWLMQLHWASCLRGAGWSAHKMAACKSFVSAYEKEKVHPQPNRRRSWAYRNGPTLQLMKLNSPLQHMEW